MPVYEYACRSCGRRFEVIHRINDPAPSTCEVCGGVLGKVLSAPAIVFRGSGWAKKDARAQVGSRAEAGDGREGDKTPKPEEATKAEREPAQTAKSGTSDGASSAGSDRASSGGSDGASSGGSDGASSGAEPKRPSERSSPRKIGEDSSGRSARGSGATGPDSR